jgi:hypothetical protein
VPFVFVSVDTNGGTPLITTNTLRHQAYTMDAMEPAGLAALPELDLAQRLSAVRDAIRGRIVFTTSFGIEDQAIAHAIYTQALTIDVVTLDTGRLSPQETSRSWRRAGRSWSDRASYCGRARFKNELGPSPDRRLALRAHALLAAAFKIRRGIAQRTRSPGLGFGKAAWCSVFVYR